MKLTPIIGFEVHVELNTKSKMFCACPADHFAKEPNTQTCPVCLGLPGALPVPNKKAIEHIIAIGLAFNCQINQESKFDRKHYFYPDLAKGYQITQYDKPFCFDGHIILDSGKNIRIKRIHMEEDTAKMIHKKLNGKEVSLIDFNRSGVPLVELVTEPDLSSAQEAKEMLKQIHAVIKALGVSDADMEKGSMRLEANISIGDPKNLPNYKVEIKNVNSFRYVSRAIDYEIKRQTQLLKSHQQPNQETRGWDRINNRTFVQRVKESETDYRYFPEPDITPITIPRQLIKTLQQNLPQLPKETIKRLTQMGIELRYAKLVSKNPTLLKIIYALAKDKNIDSNKLANLLVNGKLNSKNTLQIIKDNYSQQTKIGVTDSNIISQFVDQAINNNPKAVTAYQQGNVNAISPLIGQTIALSKGTANPSTVRQLLTKKLATK